MAVIIVLFIFFAVGFLLYKKKKIGVKGELPQSLCDNNSKSPSPIFYDHVQCTVKLFDFSGFILNGDEHEKKINIERLNDSIQDYVDEMISLYNRRGEHYCIDFNNFTYGVMVVVKHWD